MGKLRIGMENAKELCNGKAFFNGKMMNLTEQMKDIWGLYGKLKTLFGQVSNLSR